MDSISVNDINYPVEQFTNNHLAIFSSVLATESQLAGFRVQCDAAEILREVICPEIPDSVVKLTAGGKYIWMLRSEEIPLFVCKIQQVYFVRQLDEAIAQGADNVDELRQVVAQYEKLLAPTLPQPSGVVLPVLEMEPATP